MGENSVIVTVAVSNIIGVVLMFIMFLANVDNMSKGNRDFRSIFTMGTIIAVSCVVDVVTYCIDGKHGVFVTVCIYVCNMWLYFSNMAVAYLWVKFLSHHIGYTLRKYVKIKNRILLVTGTVFLIVNLFYPIVFSVNGNVYRRESFYWIYVAIGGIFMLDSLIIYLRTKHKGGLLISFPVPVFIIPVAAGIAVQSVFYGVSVIWVSIAIAIVGTVATLKNEWLYIDQLTFTYNRFYLEQLKKRLSKKTKTELTGIMLDLNGFKTVNDTFGHSEGDEALKNAARIFVRAVNGYGKVIRYAGDEFVIIINTVDENVIGSVINGFKKGFENFNSQNEMYSLSASYGYYTFDMKEQTIDEFMNVLDERMYADKIRYYKSHERKE